MQRYQEPADTAELRELRLRVEAQDRLIAAMLEENESIHELRRSNGELAALYHRWRDRRSFAAVMGAWGQVKGVRRKLLGEPSPDTADSAGE